MIIWYSLFYSFWFIGSVWVCPFNVNNHYECFLSSFRSLKMVAFGKKLKERQIQEWQGYVTIILSCMFLHCLKRHFFLYWNPTVLVQGNGLLSIFNNWLVALLISLSPCQEDGNSVPWSLLRLMWSQQILYHSVIVDFIWVA